MSKTERNEDGSRIGYWLADNAGTSDALKDIDLARRKADAKASRLLAERECPEDLKQWSRAHGIPTFAEVTWQAGFRAGMLAAVMEGPGDE